MFFAIDPAGSIISADEASEGVDYCCAACGGPVQLSAEEFSHPKDTNCSSLSMIMAARHVMRLMPMIRLPSYDISITFKPERGPSLQELVRVTDEKTFRPSAVDIGCALAGQEMDVIFESGSWQLGILLTASGARQTSIDVSECAGAKFGIIEIEVGGLPLVKVPGGRSWAEQLQTGIALGMGFKRWIYHPREGRLAAEWHDRLERKWHFKRLDTTQMPVKTEEAESGQLRCACGKIFAGSVLKNVPCPACGLPSRHHALPVLKEKKSPPYRQGS